LINVSKWNDELLAAGKLTTVWVKARGIPRSLKNYQGICEAGSTIGLVLEVDMELVRQTKQVRMKIGVVDHTKIPLVTRVTTKELFFYDVRFELEEIVEEGWTSDENLMQALDDLDDIISDSANRGSKRQRNDAEVTGEKVVYASERTNLALEQREAEIQAQNSLDAELMGKDTAKNILPTTDNLPGNTQNDSHQGEDRVQLSDCDEEEETDNTLSQDSFSEKVEAYTGKGANANMDKSQRFSDRLAEKTWMTFLFWIEQKIWWLLRRIWKVLIPTPPLFLILMIVRCLISLGF
jgi:hypothetical protein